MAFSLLKNNTWAPLQVDWWGQLSLTKENPAPSSLSSPSPASSILDRLHRKAISWRLCGATYPQLDLTRLSWSFSLPWFEFHWLSQSTSSHPISSRHSRGAILTTQAHRPPGSVVGILQWELSHKCSGAVPWWGLGHLPHIKIDLCWVIRDWLLWMQVLHESTSLEVKVNIIREGWAWRPLCTFISQLPKGDCWGLDQNKWFFS